MGESEWCEFWEGKQTLRLYTVCSRSRNANVIWED